MILQSMKHRYQDVLHLSKQFYKHRPTTIEMARQILHQSTVIQPPPNTASRNDSYDHVGSSPRKNVIVQNMLLMDYEWTLIKYHGFPTYLQQKFQDLKMPSMRFNLLGGAADGQSDGTDDTTNENDRKDPSSKQPNNSKTKKNVARVAFMITSQQRQILQHDLQYTQQDIKSMKPIEALLLVENHVMASATTTNVMDGSGNAICGSSWKEICAKLVQENERLQALQNEEQSSQTTSTSQEEASTPLNTSAVDVDTDTAASNSNVSSNKAASLDCSSESVDGTSALQIISTKDEAERKDIAAEHSQGDSSGDEVADTSNISSKDELMKKEESESGDEDVWYEVVESRVRASSSKDESDAIVTSIALYPTLEEAKECIAYKQEHHEKYLKEREAKAIKRNESSSTEVTGDSVDYEILRRKV